ncbi:hypothetical protein PQR02_31045 [Paraburkholderia sediminicola]|uniref:Uncharacterized protein n=1 Tax=Paraburkholderia rhynchosiae TaxID=487049 RepID=A0ACC7NLH5_9BURK
MKSKHLYLLAVSATVTFGLIATPVLDAYAASSDATVPDSSVSKQELKAQKKADCKARQAKKNAELNQLEKNGYNPAGNQINYPENLQNAQQKAAGQKPTNAPAVAP